MPRRTDELVGNLRLYLRGVQEADAGGKVTLTSIFPGGCAGRWPHIHFEVYPSLTAAQCVANTAATSQIALPKSACDEVYATAGYDQSVTNLSRVTLSSGNELVTDRRRSWRRPRAAF